MAHAAAIQKKKPSKRLAIGLIAFFAVFGTFFILLSKAAVVPGTPAFGLYVSPSTASPAVGSQFSVSVYANTGTYSVQSVAAKIKYDPAQLRLDSADQNGTINVPVKLYCTASEGCAAGTALFSIGKFGYGTANTIPPTDGLLVGNLTFTALKAGPANVDIDDSADPQTGARLSGFTSSVVSDTDPTPYIALNILNGRTVQGGVYTVPGSSGTGTPPVTGGSGTTTNTGGGTTTKPGTTTTKKTTTTNNTTTTPTNTTTTPTDTTTQTTPTDNQQKVVATTNNDNNNDSSAGDNPKSVSTPMILVGSAALAGLIVGTVMLAFSAPVREAVMGAGHLLHHNTTPMHAVSGPSGPIHVTDPINHIEPPKVINPDTSVAPGNVVSPNETPKPPSEV